MSEDDRAARAARAKAMLKKRQREKAGGASIATSSSGVASPISPSRTLSPAPREPVEEDKSDLGDVFTKGNSDTSWLSSLPRAPSPSAPASRVASPAAATSSPRSPLTSPPASAPEPLLNQINVLQSQNTSLADEVKRLKDLESTLKQAEIHLEEQRARVQDLQTKLQQLEVEKETALRNEQQTISLLVSEKSSLTTELQRLEDVESKAHTLENLLEKERQNAKALDERVLQLKKDQQDTATRAEESIAKEKEIAERYREKERELQLNTSALNDLKHEAEQYQRRVRELEEQIQSDDRVERLENSLKNTQDRADELEFQLSKVKQAHTTLKVDRDEIDAQRRIHANNESELEAKHTELQGLHTAVLQQLATVVSEKDTLGQEKSEIQAQADSFKKTLSQLQEKLTQAAAAIESNARQLQATQNELKAANRRAEDAAQTQKDLQAEGTNLMHSLDEMRPKIVELTGIKLELTETISSLQLDLRNSRTTISQLESSLQEATEEKEKHQKQSQELLATREKERSLTSSDLSELQRAYAELQEELDGANASLHNLEAERSSHIQEASRRLNEIERVTSSSQAQEDELSTLRNELEVLRNAQDEGQDFLERAQNEIESLRTDLSARDEEIAHLREVVSSPTRTDAPQSLDDELLSSLRQQHALDLSAAQSQIRALENSVYEANARSHTLQKHVNALEDQLAHSRSRPTSRLGHRSFSPIPGALRASSRTRSNSDIRRSSFGSHRPSNLGVMPPLARSIFDQNMSAETRHKRLVSLSMLKARIDSEVEVTISRPSSRASSVRVLSPVQSASGSRPGSPHSHSHSRAGHIPHRPQFLDDSHVFWCHSCTGDLVIL
ncbi:hypothetical protein Hypma_015998 [Hypsizygus marmoreus]|uniref:Uncharacterized protein n=1 Tax=Hypsizygus marmoreus TaxID=39966 RepID=A0A369K465_HYPMA|nr:hypothetical protein Hypma_015998 [Hypsizygus marmoreus]